VLRNDPLYRARAGRCNGCAAKRPLSPATAIAFPVQQCGGSCCIGDQDVDPFAADGGVNGFVLALAAGDADATWGLAKRVGIDADHSIIESAQHVLPG
jgi:hypothetical protein